MKENYMWMFTRSRKNYNSESLSHGEERTETSATDSTTTAVLENLSKLLEEKPNLLNVSKLSERKREKASSTHATCISSFPSDFVQKQLQLNITGSVALGS